jgi:hypothetical protein
VKTDCFDYRCEAPAAHELLGLDMCTPHYVEALEHSAHLVLKTPAEYAEERRKGDAPVLAFFERRLAERKKEKKQEGSATGRPSRYSDEDDSRQKPNDDGAGRSALPPAASLPDAADARMSLPDSSECKPPS